MDQQFWTLVHPRAGRAAVQSASDSACVACAKRQAASAGWLRQQRLHYIGHLERRSPSSAGAAAAVANGTGRPPQLACV